MVKLELPNYTNRWGAAIFMYRPNTSHFDILTPEGFSKFDGIQKVKRNIYQHLIFDDDTEIKTSLDHIFIKDWPPTNNNQILSKNIKVNDVLSSKVVIYNETVEEDIELYEPINVDKNRLYLTNEIVSHNCDFLGSINTLIAPSKLKVLTYRNPIKTNAGLDVYEYAKENHTYMISVDVSRGTSKDYSAFVVIDISEIPYKVVAKYRDNEIKPLLFPSKIYDVGQAYNLAFVMVEINDIGEQVANILQFDLEYDNLMMSSMRGRAGQVLGGGFSGGRAQLGVRTTKTVKRTGCSNLKQLIEDDKLIIEDLDIISELSTFIVKGKSFEADEGCTDDLVACLFMFGWAIDQAYFKELTDVDVRKTMMKEQREALEQDMAPFGFIITGLEEENIGEMVDEYGTKWNPVVRWNPD